MPRTNIYFYLFHQTDVRYRLGWGVPFIINRKWFLYINRCLKSIVRGRVDSQDFQVSSFIFILCNCVLSVSETFQMIRWIMCKWYVVNFSGAELTITCLFFPTQWYDPGQWWLKRENNFLERKTRDTNQGLNVWKNSINSREIQYQYIYMQYLMIAKV